MGLGPRDEFKKKWEHVGSISLHWVSKLDEEWRLFMLVVSFDAQHLFAAREMRRQNTLLHLNFPQFIPSSHCV